MDAVLVGFLPGPDAGNAMVDIIAGITNPSGRVPLTYPKFADAGGSPYYHAVSDQCTSGDGPLPHYTNGECDVQWPFGHGLSYTQFSYSELSLSSDTISYRAKGQSLWSMKPVGSDTLDVSVRVKNVGKRAGAETVMFFTNDESRRTTPEVKRLRSFEKIYLQPGQEKVVSTSLSLNDPDFWSVGPHDDSHYVIQDGMRFIVSVRADINCRDPNDSSPVFCSEFVTIDAGNDYSSICDAACTVWSESGCGGVYGLSPASCWDRCKAAGEENADGW